MLLCSFVNSHQWRDTNYIDVINLDEIKAISVRGGEMYVTNTYDIQVFFDVGSHQTHCVSVSIKRGIIKPSSVLEDKFISMVTTELLNEIGNKARYISISSIVHNALSSVYKLMPPEKVFYKYKYAE